MIDYGKRVLDVGCATGYIGEILRSKKRCYVVGIEADYEAAAVASRRYDQVIEADVEQLNSLPFPIGFFDVLLCSDVLEHLKDLI
jgi:2-polyprenyl-3-methyl-5-hydroxy-6-metoxy-1,4-benzoquinol methylase